LAITSESGLFSEALVYHDEAHYFEV